MAHVINVDAKTGSQEQNREREKKESERGGGERDREIRLLFSI